MQTQVVDQQLFYIKHLGAVMMAPVYVSGHVILAIMMGMKARQYDHFGYYDILQTSIFVNSDWPLIYCDVTDGFSFVFINLAF